MPAPFVPNHVQQPLPALYLYPLNDSFIPKHIHLPPSQRVKIGRQTNAKTAPGERNGFFDSKVLSRQHAEVWEEAGKIYIKDVKSSNGTFINGERLSLEGAESDPFELKSDDIVEFGIDIVGEDNKTIIHHKVAARVLCVLTEQDAQAAARVEQHQNPPVAQPGASNGSNAAFSFANSQAGPGGPAQRRPTMQQGLTGMGGMGGNMRAPGKSGLTFDHILNRLQGELQKSRETSAELNSLTGAMTEIHETLGGNLPQNISSYPQTIPPVIPPQAPPADPAANGNQAPPSALAELQAQLRDTQASLASHVDKIRALEGILGEHEAIKREVGSLRELMEEEKRELDSMRGAGRRRSDGDYAADDDDDAHSVSTVTPHELERVEEEDEEQLAAEEEEEERRRRRDELGRPRTPEPTGIGMDDEDFHSNERKMHLSVRSRSPSPPRDRQHDKEQSSATSGALPSEMTERLNALSLQLESALELSRTLQAQHDAAQTTISALESKVNTLESLVQSSRAQTQERASLSELIVEWKKSVEGQWSGVQEEWAQERTRLSKAHDEWETRMRIVESSVGAATEKLDVGLANLQQQQQQFQHHNSLKLNGNARTGGGLVTPPSPRSLSSDSGKQRHRRKRSASSRGRSRSRSIDSKDPDGEYASSSESATLLDVSVPALPSSSPRSRPRSPWMPDDMDSAVRLGLGKGADLSTDRPVMPSHYPITPESSVRKSSTGSSATMTTEGDSMYSQPANYVTHAKEQFLNQASGGHHITQMSIGFIVLSVAAAAVLYRVKAE
ncbi:hypothetical protein DENSPDRAFT_821141 [Dentipellis sp. KUC8613]|nr:hypothetical protein DENSPDRAFT_821141 [Dentipellis sp. KUC8613]